jgi:tetratricopeptide (TPR) repeat protein
MPAKKKAEPPSATNRMNNRPASPNPKAGHTPATAQSQLAAFEGAIRHFHARRFQEAKEMFQLAQNGPGQDVRNRAILHIRMCDQRLQQAGVQPKTAEEHYTYGVALINARNLIVAREHLRTAAAMAPEGGHIHYSLALANALLGDLPVAYQHLQRAIEIEPGHRIAARQDVDFAPFAHLSPLDGLLYPERKVW